MVLSSRSPRKRRKPPVFSYALFVNGGTPPKKIHPKCSSEQVFLARDSCHREEGKSLRELQKHNRVKSVFFGTLRFGVCVCVCFWASGLNLPELN